MKKLKKAVIESFIYPLRQTLGLTYHYDWLYVLLRVRFLRKKKNKKKSLYKTSSPKAHTTSQSSRIIGRLSMVPAVFVE